MENSLKEDLAKLEPYWDKTTKQFFEATDKIFNNHPWKLSEFIAYLTIFSRYRYNLDEGYFYIPPNFSYGSWNLVCMHEMLHFHFFDYWDKHFSGRLEKGKLWDLSEILNVLILNEHPFRYLGGQDTPPYPAHKEKYEELKPLWNSRKDLNDFLEKAIVRV